MNKPTVHGTKGKITVKPEKQSGVVWHAQQLYKLREWRAKETSALDLNVKRQMDALRKKVS